MPVDDVITGATTDALPVAPSLAPTLEAARVPPERSLVDMRVVFISFLAVIVAAAAGLVAQALTRLIGLVTNLSFYGRFSTDFSSPADNHLGAWVMIVPVLGGILVASWPATARPPSAAMASRRQWSRCCSIAAASRRASPS